VLIGSFGSRIRRPRFSTRREPIDCAVGEDLRGCCTNAGDRAPCQRASPKIAVRHCQNTPILIVIFTPKIISSRRLGATPNNILMVGISLEKSFMQIAIALIFVVGPLVVLYWLLDWRGPRRPSESQYGSLRRARRLLRIAIERAAHRDVHWLIARERERHL
jgi:hypothetical protein